LLVELEIDAHRSIGGHPEVAKQLALYTGADTVFASTTTGEGESVTVAVKVIDIKTGTTIAVGDVAIRQGTGNS